VKSSDQLDQLAPALAKAQGMVEVAGKDKTASVQSQKANFKYSYADLPAVVAACRKALSSNGLSVVQSAKCEGPRVTVTTRLLHASGQWIEDDGLTFHGRDDSPQSIGSMTTYGRRYGVMLVTGVVADDEDDDAHSAQPERPHPSVETAKRTFPGSEEVKDEWHVGRFKSACGRLWPGVTQSDLEELTDGALELMGANRKMLPAKGGVWALFMTGGIDARRHAIEAAEKALANADNVPDFKGDK
jgi:hypothetical protein